MPYRRLLTVYVKIIHPIPNGPCRVVNNPNEYTNKAEKNKKIKNNIKEVKNSRHGDPLLLRP